TTACKPRTAGPDVGEGGAPARHPAAAPRRRRRPARPPASPYSYLLAAVVAILTLLGLVMVLSASSVTALHVDGSSWTYFRKQAVWLALGTAALLVARRVPYQAWRRFTPTLVVISFALMTAVLVPGIGHVANG